MKKVTKEMADNFARAIFGKNVKFDYFEYYEGSNHVIDFGIGYVQLNIYKQYGEDAPFAPKGCVNPFGYINVGLITVTNVELLENGSVNVTPCNYECGVEEANRELEEKVKSLDALTKFNSLAMQCVNECNRILLNTRGAESLGFLTQEISEAIETIKKFYKTIGV